MNDISIYNEIIEDFQYNDIIIKVVEKALEIENVKNASCSIIIVDVDNIQKLNKEYRGIDKVTDVISFALEDENSIIIPDSIRLLGDIYICLPKAIIQAEEYGHSLKRELCFLAVHGIYHLLGYDHQTEEDAKIMTRKQEEVLEKYGIKREK